MTRNNQLELLLRLAWSGSGINNGGYHSGTAADSLESIQANCVGVIKQLRQLKYDGLVVSALERYEAMRDVAIELLNAKDAVVEREPINVPDWARWPKVFK